MMTGMSEFDLIRRHFTRAAKRAVLGVGDDAALLTMPAGSELAVSTDMLVSGVHFFDGADPNALGHKALAVNLSDLAAMGASPRWATLALALPEVNESWLTAFSAGFFALADLHQVDLVGGDTTRGPLNISITVGGEVPVGAALRRDGAKLGDEIWISGSLGDAALALAGCKREVAIAQADKASLNERLNRPTPRVELGVALRGVAHAAIDVSDGLVADLGHILQRSHCGGSVEFADLPQSVVFARYGATATAIHCALAGGDDYELCFTAPPTQRDAILALAAKLGLPLTRIGRIETDLGLRVRDTHGNPIDLVSTGFEHF